MLSFKLPGRLLVVLVFGCGLLFAAHFRTLQRPISARVVAAESQIPAADNEGEEADSQPEHDFRVNVRNLLNQEDFSQLEGIASSARSDKSRFRGGGWKLKAFYAVIENPGSLTATDAVWNAHLERLNRWMAMDPDSSTPRVALALGYVRFGVKARGPAMGGGNAEGQQLFAERVKTAQDILAQARALSTKDAEWYWAMQVVSLSQNWTRQQAEQLLAEASAFEPGYYYFYNRYAAYLFFNGKRGEPEEFAQTIADRVGGPEGDSIYFQLSMSMNCCGVRGPHAPRLAWDRVKQGFTAVEQLFGSTNLQRNAMAFMAARLGDKDFAQQLFARIGDDWDQYVWRNKAAFDQCKASLNVAATSSPKGVAATPINP